MVVTWWIVGVLPSGCRCIYVAFLCLVISIHCMMMMKMTRAVIGTVKCTRTPIQDHLKLWKLTILKRHHDNHTIVRQWESLESSVSHPCFEIDFMD